MQYFFPAFFSEGFDQELVRIILATLCQIPGHHQVLKLL